MTDFSRFNSPEANNMGSRAPIGENDPVVQEQKRLDEENARLQAELDAAANTPPAVEPVVEPPATVEPPVAAVPPVVVPPAAPVEEEDDLFKKVNGLWEVRVKSLIPGGQDQVYRGKTQKEVARQMAGGQANAQKRIHELDRAKRLKNILLEPEVLAPVQTFERKQLTADEQYKLTNQLTDPAKAPGALRTLIEAELGAPLDVVRGSLNRANLEAEENRSRVIAREWANEHAEEFYADQYNIDKLGNFFKDRGWSVTTKNLDIAFSFLDASGELHERPVESEVVAEVPAATTAAPVAAPAATPPAVPAAAPAGALPAAAPALRPADRPASSTSPTRESTTVRGSTPATPATPALVLTVEEYRRTPMSDVRRRYRNEPAYRAAVDKLIADKQI